MECQTTMLHTVRRPVTVRNRVGYRDNHKLFYIADGKVKFDNCVFNSIEKYNNAVNEDLYRISRNFDTDELNVECKITCNFKKRYIILTVSADCDMYRRGDQIYIFPKGIKLNFYNNEYLIMKPLSEIVPELEKILLLDEGSLNELNAMFVLLEMGNNNDTE